jgi:rhamnose transport system ATP-binding protein
MSVPAHPLVQLQGVSRSFGGIQAVSEVDLELRAGEIHALVGENGAGKSTLVKILTGVHEPDSGVILVAGEEQRIRSTHAAQLLGIAAMYQEPSVYLDLSVAENIFAGRRPRGLLGSVDWPQMHREAAVVLDQLGVDFGPDTPVRGLGVADRQLLEIAKALSTEARVLIMDEPTAALSPREVENLFRVARSLRDRGVALVFISHRLEEVSAVADVVTVLRDGRHVATRPAGELSHAEIVRLMVGRSLETLFPKEEAEIGDVALELRGFTRHGVFSDVSFAVRRGEILGLAGLVGAGRSEIARRLFGIDPYDGGEVLLAGAEFRPRSPRRALRRGLAYLPEDRLGQGLVQMMSIATNTSLAVLPQLTRGGFLRPWLERRLARRFIDQLRIKASSAGQEVRTLSGGNQQKVVLSKWLAAEPRVLILDEPTRGVDIGAKADVHRTISHLAAQGLAIVLISSELPEALGMSDRIVVLREGHVAAELERTQATSERIMDAATRVSEEAA